MSPGPPPLRYEPLERLHLSRPVDRIAFVVEQCVGKSVLDLGALDETAVAVKRGGGTWLHEAIAAVAREVVGVDASEAVPAGGLPTAANARIVRGDVTDLGRLLDRLEFRPDVVVAGELIEHLPNPLQFLRALAALDRLRGRALILTTPNATAIHNVLVGLGSRESTHRDHLCIFSYKSLHTLCRRAELVDWEVIPYRARFTEMRARNPGWRGLLVAGAERAVNAAEWMFPLLSFGYVVRATI